MKRFGLCLSAVLLASSTVLAATFHVAPGGNDANPGTARKPFATIAKARDAARACNGKDNIIVLAPGRYFHADAVLLDERDSGLTIRGAQPGATAEIYGGLPVTGWERWKGNIWRAPVPKGQRFFNLIADGHSLTMARTPNAGGGYGGGAKSVGHQDTWRPREEVFVPDAWRGYDYSDAQVFAFHDSNWFSEMHAILSAPDKDGIMKVTKGNIGQRLFIRGVLEFLDEPGEWCLKNREGFVYYWPKCGSPADQVVIRPTVENVIVIQGTSQATPAKNITIENLSFIGSDFSEVWTPGPDNTSPSPRGMVFGENVEGLAVRNCRLLAAGHCAVMLNKYAQNCVVERNLILEAGFVGVYMNGWPIFEGPFKDAAESYVNKGHRIEGNFIYDCGKFVGAGCGIQFYQSGDNLVARNEVGQMPRYGISYKGLCYVCFGRHEAFGKKISWDNHWEFLHTRNNRIVGNEIYSVCRNSHDFGAIESWGPGRDNLWENNAVHDVDATLEWDGYGNILYADDHNHFLTMRNNILYHCNGGAVSTAFSMKSVGQTTENNLLVDSELGIVCGLGPFREPCWGSIVRHNVFAIVPRNTRYNVNEGNFKGFTGGVMPKLPPDARGIVEINRNAVMPRNSADPNPRPYPEYGIDKDSFFGDALVKRGKPQWDIQYRDYSLAANSPAFALGFKAISVDSIGLPADFPFDTRAAVRRAATDKIQAEDYQRMSGLRTEGGKGLFHISAGAWAKYANIDFGPGKADTAQFQLESSATSGPLVELHLDSPTGQLIGRLDAGRAFCPLAGASGVHQLFLVFPSSAVRSVDWFKMLLPADARTSTVSVGQQVVANDGASPAIITITLRDQRGNFVPNKAVELKSSRGAADTISAASGVSSAVGEVTFRVTSATAGDAALTATDTTDGLAIVQGARVTFSPDAASAARSSVEVAPQSLRADGVAAATVTVTLRDGRGRPVPGKNVAIAKIAGIGTPEIAVTGGTTDGTGVARFKVKSASDDKFVFRVVDTTDHMALAGAATVMFTPMADAKPAYTNRSDGRTVARFEAGRGTWIVPAGVTNLEILVVGGGGGGGRQAGGAGAGGLYYSAAYAVVPSSPITVVVGEGGAPGKNGSPSVFGLVTAYGGAGTDGYHSLSTENPTRNTSEGGEQGGHFDGTMFHAGNRGGTAAFDGVYDSGGGAGKPGSHGNAAVGGIGVENRITGTAMHYAAGGSALEGTVGAPGGAGHRTGGSFGKATYSPAENGTGAGGQGGWGVEGNKGASGVVIVAY